MVSCYSQCPICDKDMEDCKCIDPPTNRQLADQESLCFDCGSRESLVVIGAGIALCGDCRRELRRERRRRII